MLRHQEEGAKGGEVGGGDHSGQPSDERSDTYIGQGPTFLPFKRELELSLFEEHPGLIIRNRNKVRRGFPGAAKPHFFADDFLVFLKI